VVGVVLFFWGGVVEGKKKQKRNPVLATIVYLFVGILSIL
jgi:hypothetical protein